MAEIRDRNKEIRQVRAGDLVPNPKNFREHDEYQAKALRSVLDGVGFVGAVLAREMEDGRLMLIDGHLRQSLDPEQIIPVQVVDVDEAEADRLLATIDPIAEMATVDGDALRSLLGDVRPGVSDAYGVQFLEDLADSNRAKSSGGGGGSTQTAAVDEAVLVDQSIQLRPQREYAVLMCADADEWERLKVALDLGPVRRGGYKEGSMFDAVGTQRVVHAADVLHRLEVVGKDGD